MYNYSYLLSLSRTREAKFKSCQSIYLKPKFYNPLSNLLQEYDTTRKYCAKVAKGRMYNYEPWTIRSIIWLCQLYAFSISWLNKSLRKAWMLTHILFILARWLLEILFLFYSNYFFFFHFRFQPIEMCFLATGLPEFKSAEKQLLYFISLIPKLNIYNIWCILIIIDFLINSELKDPWTSLDFG